MIDRQALAWLAAGVTTVAVAALFLRRATAFERVGGEQRTVKRASLAAFLSVSGSGG
ncbi:MAG TPA: hypothetical protein VJG32_17285 [Anaerolineae bacterium]|nr:hypothetical protein [Anaerolineae bacterium]